MISYLWIKVVKATSKWMMMIKDTKPWYASQLTADLADYKPTRAQTELDKAYIIDDAVCCIYCVLYVYPL